MTGWPAEALCVLSLAACLAAAIVRPRGLGEAAIAVPAAALVVVSGAVSFARARHIIGELAPTVAFLAGILAFGHLCAQAGVFRYLGVVAAQRSAGDPRRLLTMFVAIAALVTATLTLDAAVVLLTPIVIGTAVTLAVPARPHAYACVEIANAGSLLLPVSNLTNLLAFAATGLSFGQFVGVMALPWLAAVLLQWAALRIVFAADLRSTGTPTHDGPRAPRFALVVLAVTVAGFVVTSAFGVAPAWAAFAGVLLLAPTTLRRRQTTLPAIVASANLGFCVFVFALGICVAGVVDHGLGEALARLVPDGTTLLSLLAIAVIAAVLANLLNNLPATLLLLPLTTGHPTAVLAALIGVNIGPNLTFPGSLANLLWRRIVPAGPLRSAAQFHRYGALTVPISLVVTTVLLWLGAHAFGI